MDRTTTDDDNDNNDDYASPGQKDRGFSKEKPVKQTAARSQRKTSRKLFEEKTNVGEGKLAVDKQGIAGADAVCETAVAKKGQGISGLNNPRRLTVKLKELVNTGWTIKARRSQKHKGIEYESPAGEHCKSYKSDILDETLSKMKRELMNNRRSIGDEENQVRSKKLKQTTKMKNSRNQIIEDKTAEDGGRERKRTALSWWIEMGFVPLHEKVKSMKMEGEIIEDGILCSCCEQVLTVSDLGKHGGTKLHQEYEDKLVEKLEISLLQRLRDAWKKQDKTQGDDPSDDICGICRDYGASIRCDACYSTFHERCLGMKNFDRLQERLEVKKHVDEIRKDFNDKIDVALEFMVDCFEPIIAHRRDITLTQSVLYNYGSDVDRLDFSGLYTFIFEEGDEILCAASIRINGIEFAEMPHFEISDMYKCPDMHLQLLNNIEPALHLLSVGKLIRPATSKTEDSWISALRCNPLEIKASTSDWEKTKVISGDGEFELSTDVFYASFDQASDNANGPSACAALAVVVANWLLTNEYRMPTKTDEFNCLIRDGSRKWRELKEKPEYRREFPDGHFDIPTILKEKIRPVSIVGNKSFSGVFQPNAAGEDSPFKGVMDLMSSDIIWGEISQAGSEIKPHGSPLIYVVSFNDHFFVLDVEHDAYYIVDTLGCKLKKDCKQGYILKFDNKTSICKLPNNVQAENEDDFLTGKESCKEYMKRFLGANQIRNLEDRMKKGKIAYLDILKDLQIDFFRMETSRVTSQGFQS